AAEESYAEIALSPEFRTVYGELVNAQMRVRAGVQAQIEQVAAMFDMPTRTELDGAHRKIVELERAVRRLRDALEAGQAGGAETAALPPPTGSAAGKAAKKAARTTAKKTARPAKKAAARKATPTRTAAKKAAAKKAASKKAAKKTGGAAGAARRRE